MDENNEVLEYSDVYLTEEQNDIDIVETVEIIDVSDTPTYAVDSDVAFPALGEANEYLNHQLLNGKELPDQHPITAITGLREELNDIEALDVVYSDKRNRADYYLWKDKNILQENRVGYFVSACSDINEIELCTSSNDVFGVTVDGAGFVGAQADVARDIKYGLVVTNGIVHVRCEASVVVGDYVVSNDYGYAQKNKSGYKVVGRHQIDGLEYAEITLVTPIGRICELSNEVDNVGARMDNAETNIVAAMNVANAAYNKASDVGYVSEKAVKNALEALEKANDATEKTDDFESRLEDAKELSVQAKAIADSAVRSAVEFGNDAINRANDAWAKSENVANEYLWLTANIDEHSVGEYSQAYGLTLEQAASILEVGMIYIPTKHLDIDTHSETYVYTDDDGNQQKTTYYFTPHNYYEWNGTIWVEHSNSVAFFSEEPLPNNALRYWYIDSNDAPEGYEPHALYIVEDGKWKQVNTLAGNVNNRITSMIWQTADEISIEITNARGSYTNLVDRITDTESEVQTAAGWMKGKTSEGEELYNIATVKQATSGDGSNLALVVADTEGNKIINGASIVLNNDDSGSSISLDADYINFNTGTFKLDADYINLNGYATINDWFSVDKDGYMHAIGGTIGGWSITSEKLTKSTDAFQVDIKAPTALYDGTNATTTTSTVMAIKNIGDDSWPFIVRSDGSLFATKAKITGTITTDNVTATGGNIAGWMIKPTSLRKVFYDDTTNRTWDCFIQAADTANNMFAVRYTSDDYSSNYGQVAQDKWTYQFAVNKKGILTANGVKITGTINAEKGNFTRDVTIAGRSISQWMNEEGYINEIKANTGTVGGWSIGSDASVGIKMTSLYNSNGITYITSLNESGIKTSRITDGNQVISDEFSVRWDQVTSHIFTASDRRIKTDIVSFDDNYDNFFDILSPCVFKFTIKDKTRKHSGFIAQEVQDALLQSNLSDADFGAIDMSNNFGYDDILTLDKEEFIALNTWQIQKAKSRITELENKVAELEKLIKE